MNGSQYKFRPTRIHKYPSAELEKCYDVEMWDEFTGRAVLQIKGRSVTVDTSDVTSCGASPAPPIQVVERTIKQGR